MRKMLSQMDPQELQQIGVNFDPAAMVANYSRRALQGSCLRDESLLTKRLYEKEELLNRAVSDWIDPEQRATLPQFRYGRVADNTPRTSLHMLFHGWPQHPGTSAARLRPCG
jgi:hypothetical protein